LDLSLFVSAVLDEGIEMRKSCIAEKYST